MCLDVSGTNSSSNGQNVQGWQCNQVTETWHFGPDDKIHADWNPNMCLNVVGNQSSSNGQNVNITARTSVEPPEALGGDPGPDPVPAGPRAGGTPALPAGIRVLLAFLPSLVP